MGRGKIFIMHYGLTLIEAFKCCMSSFCGQEATEPWYLTVGGYSAMRKELFPAEDSEVNSCAIDYLYYEHDVARILFRSK